MGINQRNQTKENRNACGHMKQVANRESRVGVGHGYLQAMEQCIYSSDNLI
tara:strand:+ start:11228 stop:11380 length:153 start_codon:yes stop_codon:yes gene_type:complete